MTYDLNNLNEVAQSLIENQKNNTYLFFGEMGVGKTTLIKAVVKQLGTEDHVSSPTYALVNEYQTKDKPVYHFDFYRIKDIEEVYDIGFEDYLAQDAYILIEWPELIKDLWPEHFVRVDLSFSEQGKRQVKISDV